jgi:hypothetical protein
MQIAMLRRAASDQPDTPAYVAVARHRGLGTHGDLGELLTDFPSALPRRKYCDGVRARSGYRQRRPRVHCDWGIDSTSAMNPAPSRAVRTELHPLAEGEFYHF